MVFFYRSSVHLFLKHYFMKSYFLNLIIIIVFFSTAASAQPGVLDPGFGTGGFVTTQFSGLDEAVSVAEQPDGKIVAVGSAFVGGHSKFALTRYMPDGTPDASFGINGKVTEDFGYPDYDSKGFAVQLQADGKIVVSGYYYLGIGLARFTSNGGVDSTFGAHFWGITANNGGIEPNHSLVLLPGGKILLSSAVKWTGSNSFTYYFLRYLQNGHVDPQASQNGGDEEVPVLGEEGDATSVLLQPDGKYLLCGWVKHLSSYKFVLARINPDITKDATFGNNGLALVDFGNQVAKPAGVILEPDGKILIAANVGSNGMLLKLKPDGTLDPTFGDAGKVVFPFGNNGTIASLALQSDGKLVLGGGSDDGFTIGRRMADGSPDLSFGTGGFVTNSFGGDHAHANMVYIQSDGKILVPGQSVSGTNGTFVVARYLSGLELGLTEHNNSLASAVIYPNPVSAESVVKFTLQSAEEVSIELLDNQGRLVRIISSQTKVEAGTYVKSLGFPGHLPSGCYTVQLITSREKVGIRVFH
jgi:uncharacterized delta-60 repeat protein